MTIIAFDGYTIAADKLADNNGLQRTVTKLFKVECPLAGNAIVGFSGNFSVGLELVDWVRNGEQKDSWPECQKTDDWSNLVVFRKDGFYTYEKWCQKQKFEDKAYATGSGRDYAMGVMEFGGSAIDAVRVTSKLCTGCGNGIDSFNLDDL